eukprot:CAMPEP_0119320724 /NCGR_PEP_ID=MMETSP1333-20130426/53224_1 /TAXON_ID=418940 /ORGANISM="Scyphosphaera apsteinii, Strain RCC1455" /LENGTH=409 /DNA_ID=CAMNT_0007327501 /DNA_START=9 /DNA_END=1234 /DNA_ORIENTATION=+
MPPPAGWLWKEGHKWKTWKQRWFVLEEGHLRYYHSPEALEPIATIIITGAEILSCRNPRPGKYAFRLNTVKQEDGYVESSWRIKYIMAGESEKESLNWIKALMSEGAGGELLSISVLPKNVKRPGMSHMLQVSFSMFLNGKRNSDTSSSFRDDRANSEPSVPSLVVRKSLLQMSAEKGTIDGNAPFDQVRATLGRRSFEEQTLVQVPADDDSDDEQTKQAKVEAVSQRSTQIEAAQEGAQKEVAVGSGVLTDRLDAAHMSQTISLRADARSSNADEGNPGDRTVSDGDVIVDEQKVAETVEDQAKNMVAAVMKAAKDVVSTLETSKDCAAVEQQAAEHEAVEVAQREVAQHEAADAVAAEVEAGEALVAEALLAAAKAKEAEEIESATAAAAAAEAEAAAAEAAAAEAA